MLLQSDKKLEFFEQAHRYRYDGEWMLNSVTRVCNDLTPEAQERIEATRLGPDGWQERGNAVHQCLEKHLLGLAGVNKDGLVYDDKWSPWVEPLLNHWLFDGCTVMAVELRLCDPKKSLAGSLDFIIQDSKGQICLGDLKTCKTAKAAQMRKPATKQLGGYLQMLLETHLTYVDKCVTVAVGPETVSVKTNDPDECLAEWIDAWIRYDALIPDF